MLWLSWEHTTVVWHSLGLNPDGVIFLNFITIMFFCNWLETKLHYVSFHSVSTCSFVCCDCLWSSLVLTNLILTFSNIRVANCHFYCLISKLDISKMFAVFSWHCYWWNLRIFRPNILDFWKLRLDTGYIVVGIRNVHMYMYMIKYCVHIYTKSHQCTQIWQQDKICAKNEEKTKAVNSTVWHFTA